MRSRFIWRYHGSAFLSPVAPSTADPGFSLVGLPVLSYRREITRGAFARTVALPAGVDTENVKASFKDGVLELVLAKTHKAARRQVKLD